MTDASHESHPVRQEYDRLAPQYDRRWRPYIEATMNAVCGNLELSGDEVLLDVPCGTGELATRLLARWPHLRITGVDLSPAMLREARRKDPEQRVHWIEADVARMPLENQTFDIAVCANSFHYFRDPHGALQELHRVLQPGGSLILVDWCDDYLSCKACSWWLRRTDPAFHRAYTLLGCRRLLEENGFRVESAARFRISWLWGLMRLVGRRE